MRKELRHIVMRSYGASGSIWASVLIVRGGLGWMGHTLLIQNPILRPVAGANDDLGHAVGDRRSRKHKAHRQQTAHRERKADQQIQVTAHQRSCFLRMKCAPLSSGYWRIKGIAILSLARGHNAIAA